MVNADVHNFKEISFVAGSTEVLQLEITDTSKSTDNSLESVGVKSIEWRISKYGESECLLHKQLSTSDFYFSDGKLYVNVNLYSNETSNFYGLYTHQIIITDNNSNVYVINQGKIFIDSFIS